MTLEKLQQDMMTALKNGNKTRKSVLSMMIAQIKKAAIDKGIRNAIPEELVDAEILHYKKMMQESIQSFHVLTSQWEQACEELSIVAEYAPVLINSSTQIQKILENEYNGPITKKDMMKFLSVNYKNKMDMKVAVNTIDILLKKV